MIISIMIPKSDENPMDPSLTNGESRSIVSVPDGAGQTDGSVHTEVHLLLQLQQGEIHPSIDVVKGCTVTVYPTFIGKIILQTKDFSLQECFVISVIVVFSEDDLNNCGNSDT